MVTVVNIPVPDSLNLLLLAQSTSNVVTLLRPWCTKEFNSKSKALMSIRTQALSYAKAVDCSIIAAQHGHTIAEEALGFADLMQAGSNTSEEARQLYLLGMIQIAQRGEENSKFAWRTFRNVRETLENLIKDATKEIESGKKKIFANLRTNLKDLQNGMPALEEFRDTISGYISWWNSLNMTHMAMSEGIKINYTTLRQKAVVQKWRELRQVYVDYTDKIKDIQDLNPDFFSQLATSNEQEEPQVKTADSVFSAARTKLLDYYKRSKDRRAQS